MESRPRPARPIASVGFRPARSAIFAPAGARQSSTRHTRPRRGTPPFSADASTSTCSSVSRLCSAPGGAFSKPHAGSRSYRSSWISIPGSRWRSAPCLERGSGSDWHNGCPGSRCDGPGGSWSSAAACENGWNGWELRARGSGRSRTGPTATRFAPWNVEPTDSELSSASAGASW